MTLLNYELEKMDYRRCESYGAERLIQATKVWMTPLPVKEDKS